MLADSSKDLDLVAWQAEIKARLANYDGYELACHPWGLEVLCTNPDSFPVSIQETGDAFQVKFGGWHETFSSQHEAFNCFAFGLSTACRLKVILRGRTECAWTVQSLEDGDWEDDSTVGLLVIPFWRRPSFAFRQNVLALKRV